MENFLVLLFSSCIIVTFFCSVQGACEFPTHLQGGTWRSTRWDDIVFTTDQMTIPDFDGTPITFACETKSGTKYLIRSTTPRLILTNTVDVVACLDFKSSVSGVKQIYYHATNERSLSGGLYQPVRLWSPPGLAMTVDQICTDTTYETGTNDVMINVDQTSEAAITCPTPLLANFDDYTVTDSGTAYCNGVGYIHICDDSQTVIVEYGICNKEIFYSSNGNLSCVYYSSSGGVYYTNLLNNDASVDHSSTYHYTCVAIKKSGGVWYASQWPRKCTTDQTPTSVSSSVGYTFVMNANLTCVPGGSSSSFNIIPIIAAIVAVLIIAALVYFFLIRKKKYKKVMKKMPCFNKDKKKKKKRKTQVDPTSADVSVSAAPMDGHKTGLQATAVMGYPPDRSQTITPFERRNLETAQSTRSAVTVSHMDTELVDDTSTPRRLPPLMTMTHASSTTNTINNHPESDASDTPSIPPARLPPINESLMLEGESGGAGGGGGGGGGGMGELNANSVSTSDVTATATAETKA